MPTHVPKNTAETVRKAVDDFLDLAKVASDSHSWWSGITPWYHNPNILARKIFFPITKITEKKHLLATRLSLIKVELNIVYCEIESEKEISGKNKDRLNHQISILIANLKSEDTKEAYMKKFSSNDYAVLLDALKKIENDTKIGNH